jgi:hypothetical protein
MVLMIAFACSESDPGPVDFFLNEVIVSENTMNILTLEASFENPDGKLKSFKSFGFEYKESSSSEWGSKIVGENKLPTKITGKIAALSPYTSYDIRAFAEESNTGIEYSEPITVYTKPSIVSSISDHAHMNNATITITGQGFIANGEEPVVYLKNAAIKDSVAISITSITDTEIKLTFSESLYESAIFNESFIEAQPVLVYEHAMVTPVDATEKIKLYSPKPQLLTATGPTVSKGSGMLLTGYFGNSQEAVIKLGDTNLSRTLTVIHDWLQYHQNREVHVQVPSNMATGSYDLKVELNGFTVIHPVKITVQ